MNIQKFLSIVIFTFAASLSYSLYAVATETYFTINTVDDSRTYPLIIDDDSPGIDNSIEINQAIEDLMQMGGGRLLLPPGEIIIRNSIVFPSDLRGNIHIIGSGRSSGIGSIHVGGTRIQSKINDGESPAMIYSVDGKRPLAMAARPMFIDVEDQLGTDQDGSYRYGTGSGDPYWTFEGSFGPGAQIVIEDLAVIGDAYPINNRYAANADGIVLRGAYQPKLQNVTISGFSGCGLINSGSFSGHIIGSTLHGNGVGIRGYLANGFVVFNNYIHYNWVGVQNIAPKYGIIEANYHYGILIDGETNRQLNISGFFEAQNAGGQLEHGADIRMAYDWYGSVLLYDVHFSGLRDKTHIFYGRARSLTIHSAVQFAPTANTPEYPHFLFTGPGPMIVDPLGYVDGKNVLAEHVDTGHLRLDSPRMKLFTQAHDAVDVPASTSTLTFPAFEGVYELMTNDGPAVIDTFEFPVPIERGQLFKIFIYSGDITFSKTTTGNLSWSGAATINPKRNEILTWVLLKQHPGGPPKWYLDSRTGDQ